MAKQKKPKKCKFCDTELRYKKQTYCSFECANNARKKRNRLKKKGEKVKGSARPEKSYLDELWYEAVKIKAGYNCEYSKHLNRESKGKQLDPAEGCILNAHHLLGKPNQYLRYSLDNGISLNQGVHKFVAHQPSRAEGFLQTASDIKGFNIHEKLGGYVKSSPRVDLYAKEQELLDVIEKAKKELET